MNVLIQRSLVDQLIDRVILRITRENHLCGFSDAQILLVLREAQKSLEPQPALIEIEAPIVIFGDIHGQLNDLLRFMAITGPPPKNKFLFLGDYVDRCKKSFEVIMLLLCYRIKYPNHIYLLRGNHECLKMNRLYGFYEEMRRKRSVYMWKQFQTVFNELPLCAVVSKRLLCMHGGISPEITGWNTLYQMSKPKTPRSCDEGIIVDLMWSDPSHNDCTGFQFNSTRATSYVFGGDCVDHISDLLGITMIVRAHEVTQEGHLFLFSKKLVTIFSAPNYCGIDDNSASIMKVSDKMEISFVTLKPRINVTKLTEEKRILLKKMSSAINANSPNPCSTYAPSDMDAKQSNLESLSCRIQKTGKRETSKEANIDCVISGSIDMFKSYSSKQIMLFDEQGKRSIRYLTASLPLEASNKEKKPKYDYFNRNMDYRNCANYHK